MRELVSRYWTASTSIRYNIIKVLMDRLLTLPFFIISLPIIGLSAVAIKIFSLGSAFFIQERIGHRGKLIYIWKLRTMHMNAENLLEEYLEKNPDAKQEWEQYFKLKNDPRIIPVIGNLLRKTSLDELPQLWNVLKGDMSLVGPRPFPKYHLETFPENFQEMRQQVVPGLTGLWQVSSRSDGDTKDQEALDTKYIKERSLLLDIKIIFKTVYVVLMQKGAC